MNPSRRAFFQHTAVASTTGVFGGLGLSACTTVPTAPLDPLLSLGAGELVQAIKAGRVKAESYMSAVIAQAKAMNDLNALISMDEAAAMAAARQVDADRAASKPLGALAGLPLVVKDNINTKAMKTTAGTPALRNFQPTSNAPSLQKLLDAGAILLGKSNLHEWAFGITSTNFTLGTDPRGHAIRPCRNPYDKSRIPGGSSGGTAVAIAARFAPAGLGTDTGGSTRVPAAFCGIAGFRPSVGNGAGKGRRYNDPFGAAPISTTRDTLGPMARTVADLALLDSVIAGTPLPTAKPLAGLRVGIPTSFWQGLDDSVRPVAQAARKKLSDAGVVFVEADLKGIWELNNLVSFQLALHEPVRDIPAYLAANKAPVRTVQEVANALASPDVQGAFGAILGDVFGAAYDAAINTHRPAMQALYANYFRANQVDAVLFPTTVLAAPPIDAAQGSGKLSYTVDGIVQKDKETFNTCIRNTDPCTNAGIPSLSIPAGLTAGGLPVGMQIDGPLGSDRDLLAMGMAFESVWGPIRSPAL